MNVNNVPENEMRTKKIPLMTTMAEVGHKLSSAMMFHKIHNSFIITVKDHHTEWTNELHPNPNEYNRSKNESLPEKNIYESLICISSY